MTGAGNYPSCSQNAHTRKYARSMRAVKDSLPTPSRKREESENLVGSAQWEINQAPSLKRKRASLEGSSIISLDGRSRTKHGCRSEKEKQARLTK